MKRSTLNRRRLLGAGVAFGLGALAGCGGGDSDSDGDARLRLLNLSTDVDAVDFVVDDELWFEAVARGAASGSRRIDADSYGAEVRSSGAGSALLSQSLNVEGDTRYAAVVWGRATATRLSILTESEDDDDIDGGQARLRTFNAALDAGSVDVYLTAADADLADATPLNAAVGRGNASAFQELGAGIWRLRITGAGDPDDLRLDVPEVELGEQTHHTLIVAASAGGVLVDAVLLPQAADPRLFANATARLRVAAGADAAGVVAVAFGGRTLAGALRSPAVGAYTTVAAGSGALEVRVDGAVVRTQTVTLEAGVDRTLLVWGAEGSRQAVLLADDNRLPGSDTRLKLRLVHGAAAAETATLSVDYLAVASDVAAGSASAYAALAAAEAAQIDVAAPAGLVYGQSDVELVAGRVYSLFLLGGNTAPTGVLRRER